MTHHDYQWQPQPIAAAMVNELVEMFCAQSVSIGRLRDRLLRETGTRLADWVDHIVLPNSEREETLLAAGFEEEQAYSDEYWLTLAHRKGLFPRVRIDRTETTKAPRLFVLVESVADYLEAHNANVQIAGAAGGAIRQACVVNEHGVEQWVIERHGDPSFATSAADQVLISRVAAHAEGFANRPRDVTDPEAGFDEALRLIEAAAADLGCGRASDVFFAAERAYWQQRNQAARVQRRRQDALGLGWANHDHHTYRSSREWFPRLIGVFEALGCRCRERFYAGQEAGWGAQVLEHPESGIVIFADVDLSPGEVVDDFAHTTLPPRDSLGTVGLWCQLHGEAFLRAGLHHLECQFDFDAAREQLAAEGVPSMAPFTDFPFLKQAFTQGEYWPVESARLAALVESGHLDQASADKFGKEGALGSHLEILERNDGYKGFNQTGISDIIQRTDPRLTT